MRAFPTRKEFLVSNTGPDGDGYNYCVACGRIETPVDAEVNLFQPHSRPYPTRRQRLSRPRQQPCCAGNRLHNGYRALLASARFAVSGFSGKRRNGISPANDLRGGRESRLPPFAD